MVLNRASDAARCLMYHLPLFKEQARLAPLSKGGDKAGPDVRVVATTWCSRERLNCWQRQSGDEAMRAS